MTTYNLNLEISAADLQTIYQAGEKVTIGKTISPDSPPPSVVWLSFAPFENNTVTWEENYAIYASNTQGMITQTALAPFPSQTGACYPLTSQGFEAPTTCPVAVPAGEYGAWNQFTQYEAITFGLAQVASANGSATQPVAVTAELIPVNQQGIFKPPQTVWVWLQSTVQASGVLLPQDAISAPAIVTFSPQSPTQTLRYDAQQGKFVPTQ